MANITAEKIKSDDGDIFYHIYATLEYIGPSTGHILSN